MTRWTLRVIAVVTALVLLYLVATSTGRYLLRAGWEEAKILARRRSISWWKATNFAP